MARKNKGEIVSIEFVDIYGKPFDIATYKLIDEEIDKISKILGPFIIKQALENRNKSETKE